MPLTTTKKMFKDAYEGGYAVGAFNVNNMEIVQGVVRAGKKLNAPLILQVSKGAAAYAGLDYLVRLAETAAEETGLPIALNLDHGPDFETCKACVDGGFTSVMIDGSSLPYEENAALTKRVAEYAHAAGVVVEGELGRLAGVEDDVNVADEDALYTNPDQVYDFATKTGVDSLAVAIGTSHGAYKFKPGQKPRLRLDILDRIGEILPGFPIVLHGASSVPPEFVEIINRYGGKMENAAGVPEEALRKAAGKAVCKINIDSDIRLAMTAAIRKYLAENPSRFDPRQYLAPARDAVQAMVERKIETVLGCAGKA